MISSLRGVVGVVSVSSAVVEVGGVGLVVNITPDHAAGLRSGQSASMSTSLIVREDALTLYGFETPLERDVFDVLIGVSGVGPKSALGVLAALRPEEIAAAVRDENDAVFRKVSGIGPKTAKLIVLSLAGKLPALAIDMPSRSSSFPDSSLAARVLAALVALGWSERVAAQAFDDVADQVPDNASVQDALRLALASLGPAQGGGSR